MKRNGQVLRVLRTCAQTLPQDIRQSAAIYNNAWRSVLGSTKQIGTGQTVPLYDPQGNQVASRPSKTAYAVSTSVAQLNEDFNDSSPAELYASVNRQAGLKVRHISTDNFRNQMRCAWVSSWLEPRLHRCPALALFFSNTANIELFASLSEVARDPVSGMLAMDYSRFDM